MILLTCKYDSHELEVNGHIQGVKGDHNVELVSIHPASQMSGWEIFLLMRAGDQVVEQKLTSAWAPDGDLLLFPVPQSITEQGSLQLAVRATDGVRVWLSKPTQRYEFASTIALPPEEDDDEEEDPPLDPD